MPIVFRGLLIAGLVFIFTSAGILSAAEPSAYEKAFQEAQARKQPLIVLVGATWCPGCQTMKQSVMPRMAQRGSLKNVSYATVDADAEPQLAGSLMRGGAIPQLIVFHQEGGKWQREQIVGATSEGEVQRLVARAIANQDKDKSVEAGGGGGNE
jgi:thioredoxin-like negative regulator of GroEL